MQEVLSLSDLQRGPGLKNKNTSYLSNVSVQRIPIVIILKPSHSGRDSFGVLMSLSLLHLFSFHNERDIEIKNWGDTRPAVPVGFVELWK